MQYIRGPFEVDGWGTVQVVPLGTVYGSPSVQVKMEAETAEGKFSDASRPHFQHHESTDAEPGVSAM
jgi:hypothetical protein